MKKIINEAFENTFDWKLAPLKEYKKAEIENDIKEAIKEGIKLYAASLLPKVERLQRSIVAGDPSNSDYVIRDCKYQADKIIKELKK